MKEEAFEEQLEEQVGMKEQLFKEQSEEQVGTEEEPFEEELEEQGGVKEEQFEDHSEEQCKEPVKQEQIKDNSSSSNMVLKRKNSGRSRQREVKKEVTRELDTIRGIRTPNAFD